MQLKPLQTSCDAAGAGSSAWEGWLKGAFQAALAAAPLDLAEAWAAAVRFAVNTLAFTNPNGMDAVLQVIIQQPPPGTSTYTIAIPRLS